MQVNRNLKIKEKHLFLVIIITSFLVSLSFLWGNIDPDFFSFYYIGRGVAQGKDMYVDFADNKGPVLYFFFSVLYLFFKNNYKLALIVTSTILDTFLSFFSIKIATSWFKVQNLLSGKWGIFLSFFITLLIKSYSIGTFTGGVYSETVAFFFILSSLLLVERKKVFFAGILYSLAILTRPTTIFWGIVPLVWFLSKGEKLAIFLKFFVGSIVSFLSVILFYVVLGGRLDYLIDNLLVFNSGYSRLIKTDYLRQLVLNISSETRLFLSIILVIPLLYFSLLNNKLIEYKFLIFAIFFASISSTFVGGLFYFHHFVQFSLIVTIAMVLIIALSFRGNSALQGRKIIPETRMSHLLASVLLLLFISEVGSYRHFLFSEDRDSDLTRVQNFITNHKDLLDSKEYLMVVTYYPQLYFTFDKLSPDRYFQPFFLSRRFNILAEKDIKRHSKLNKETLDNTLFLIVSKNEFDGWYKEEYLTNFANKFGLKNVAGTSNDHEEVNLYVANPGK